MFWPFHHYHLFIPLRFFLPLSIMTKSLHQSLLLVRPVFRLNVCQPYHSALRRTKPNSLHVSLQKSFEDVRPEIVHVTNFRPWYTRVHPCLVSLSWAHFILTFSHILLNHRPSLAEQRHNTSSALFVQPHLPYQPVGTSHRRTLAFIANRDVKPSHTSRPTRTRFQSQCVSYWNFTYTETASFSPHP